MLGSPSGLSHRCRQKSLGSDEQNTLVGGLEAINNSPLRLSGITSSLVKVERSLWPAANGVTGAPLTLGVVLPSDIAICLSGVILKVSQIADLAMPYLEVDPGVHVV